MKPPTYIPVHPGEILKELYLDALGVSITEFATHLKTQRHALSEILHRKRGISPQMALKLADVLGTTPELWTNLQARYDLHLARQGHQKLNPFQQSA